MESKGEDSFEWKTLAELQDPFNDAVNYRTRQEKEFFSRIFLRTSDLQDCLKSSVYYLIGEKGSGKTAYAAYLENNPVDDHRCRLSTMTETQYKRFIMMKKRGQLEYSDYANIWRPMLLNMVAQAIVFKSKGLFQSVTGKFDFLEQQIEYFNRDSLNPEVEVAFEMVNESQESLKIGHDKFGKVEASDKLRATERMEQIRHHLLEKESAFKLAIGDLRLSQNHVLFVDGVDYRPEGVPYNDYLACIKGLGEAVWQVNTEFFGNIRDSKGRIKVVLLVRPDVFHKLNLYNSNSRLRDNSVFLEWATTESALRSSQLYEATGKFFSSQQSTSVPAIEAANHYLRADESDSIFKRLLRTTFQKPRDVLTFIRIARKLSIRLLGRGASTRFDADVVQHSVYTKEYADYLLGEVRDYADFYMKQDDFLLYIKFFQYLDGKAEFNFVDFSAAYVRFKAWIDGESVDAREYLRDPEALLQFFFDVNIIGYRENVGDERDRKERFVHFSFRERTLNNIAPKVKTSAVLVVNSGIAKSLDIGLKSKPQSSADAPARRRSHRGFGRGRNQNSSQARPQEGGQEPSRAQGQGRKSAQGRGAVQGRGPGQGVGSTQGRGSGQGGGSTQGRGPGQGGGLTQGRGSGQGAGSTRGRGPGQGVGSTQDRGPSQGGGDVPGDPRMSPLTSAGINRGGSGRGG